MNEVTHIPHQHISRIRSNYGDILNLVIIETKDPHNGEVSKYKSMEYITIDDKGIYGLFVKI